MKKYNDPLTEALRRTSDANAEERELKAKGEKLERYLDEQRARGVVNSEIPATLEDFRRNRLSAKASMPRYRFKRSL